MLAEKQDTRVGLGTAALTDIRGLTAPQRGNYASDHCNDRSTQLLTWACVRYRIDVKGIMTNDAAVIIVTGHGGPQLAASLRSGDYTGSIGSVGAERQLSNAAQLRPQGGHRALTTTAPHPGTGG